MVIHMEKLNELIDYFGKQITSVQKNFYIKSIEKYANSQKVFDSAIDMLIDSEKFFPTPAKIKETYFIAKNAEWYKTKDRENKTTGKLENYFDCVENPYKNIMKKALACFKTQGTPFNQTYFENKAYGLIDDLAKPPYGYEFVYTGIQLQDDRGDYQKVNALVNSMTTDVFAIIKPLTMSQELFEKFKYRFVSVKQLACTPF